LSALSRALRRSHVNPRGESSNPCQSSDHAASVAGMSHLRLTDE
jgi:hypothetical protein